MVLDYWSTDLDIIRDITVIPSEIRAKKKKKNERRILGFWLLAFGGAQSTVFLYDNSFDDARQKNVLPTVSHWQRFGIHVARFAQFFGLPANRNLPG